MKTIYQLFVEGIPKPQPRPRLANNGKVFNPHSADAWKNQIKAAFIACRQETITTPVCLKAAFYLPMPKDMKKNLTLADEVIAHNTIPDLDNFLKSLMDGITNAGIWKDDALVYKIESEKWYSPTRIGARIIIEA